MSDDKTTREEDKNDWHPLPGMIGETLVDGESGVSRACGGYIVEMSDAADIVIYREISSAPTADELEETGDKTFEISDGIFGAEEIARIPAPEDGWESETDWVSASTWGGYE